MYVKMVLRIPWPPQRVPGPLRGPLPGPFLLVLLVDLASLVDGSGSVVEGRLGVTWVWGVAVLQLAAPWPWASSGVPSCCGLRAPDPSRLREHTLLSR